MNPERRARVALSRLVEPGTASVLAAVQESGAVATWARLREGRRLPGMSAALAEGAAHRAGSCDPDADLRALERCGGRVVCPGDDEWPTDRLIWPGDAVRSAPPVVLYARGPLGLADATARSVAVVGARAATAYGSHVATELGMGLAEAGTTVVSGGAYGIDGAAHVGALRAEGAPTVAVLACGVDVAYPRGHDRLLARIAATGLVLSEVPPGCAPMRSRFLVRNRLIAALSQGTVVVEAALRSGSLSTAARAEELSRPVMAVPGPVTSAASAGCHELLRAGALCVTGARQVLEHVGSSGEDLCETPRGRADPRDHLSAVVRQVLEAVPVRRGAGEASIARTAGVATLVVQQVLPPLVVAGLVERTDGGYRLTALGMARPAAAG
ncbi:MAG: protecting protein DprA [Frankiales bacterium]|nr:protecting protein DprA [Frankiales bacterium]